MGKQLWKPVFSLDTRSLASMRILGGLLIIWDLFQRALDFHSHFTAHAVFPVEFSRQLEQLPKGIMAVRETSALFSLHNLSGATWWQALLFALTFLVTISYTVGFKSRLSAFLSLIMVISMHNRNILMLYPGDDFSRLILFFSCFLPIGAVWSVDARRGQTPRPDSYVLEPSIFGVGFLLCVLSYFSLAGLTKTGECWKQGLGVYYLLSKEGWTTSLAPPLLSQLWLVRALNYMTWCGESFLPFLMLVPLRHGLFRTVSVVTYIGMLVGFRLFLNTYHVTHLAVAFLVGALPGSVWTWILRRQTPAAEAAPPAPAPNARLLHGALQTLFVALMLLMAWSEWNRTCSIINSPKTLPMPEPLRKLALFTYVGNPWRVYFPDPKRMQDGWIVPRGYSQDGQRDLNLNTLQPFSLSKPANFAAHAGGFRWWRFFSKVAPFKPGPVRDTLLLHLGNYYCHKAQEQGLDAIEIILMDLPSVEPNQPRPAPVKTILLARRCRAD